MLAVSHLKRKSQRLLDVPQLTEDEILSRVLHRDGLMLIVNKPAGLPVHRGPKGGPNLEASFDALRYGLPRPPVLAHRLDRDTSGCLVLGRHRKARNGASHVVAASQRISLCGVSRGKTVRRADFIRERFGSRLRPQRERRPP